MSNEQEIVFEVLSGATRVDREAPNNQINLSEEALPFGSEQALAEELSMQASDFLRWSPGLEWMVNCDTHWARDEHLQRFNLAKEVCRHAANNCGGDEKIAMRICASSTASAILTLTRSNEGIVTPVLEWDKLPMVLNTPSDVRIPAIVTGDSGRS